MKTIIAGSRTINDIREVEKAIKDSGFIITEIVSGTAYGVDKLGERYANVHNIPVKRFPADWEKYGKCAGILRNIQMVEYADALIAVWNGKSKGTRNIIIEANDRNLKSYVYIINNGVK